MKNLSRRHFLHGVAAAAVLTHIPFARAADDGIAWHDPKDTGIEGKGWSDTKRFYDRLPC